MVTLESIGEADLSRLLNRKSLQRARGYVQRVKNPTRRGQSLSAQVQGRHLYEVEIEVTPGNILAYCSCPYDWGGYCKHIGAVLLKWIQSPHTFSVQDVTAREANTGIEVTPVEMPPPQRPSEKPFWLARSFEEHQQYHQENLHRWLQGLPQQDLRQLADRRKWLVKGNRKDELARQIASRMVDPGQILDAVYNLDREHLNVLRAIVLLGSENMPMGQDVQHVAEQWGKLTHYTQVNTYARHLCEVGLALPAELLEQYHPTFAFVPPAILQPMPPLLQEVVPTCSDLPPEPPIDELRPAQPFDLPQRAAQLTLLLEQTSYPRRPPQPRPRLEQFLPELRLWDYNPHEVVKLSRTAGRIEQHLTVPAPAYRLPDQAISDLAHVAGGADRLEFLLSLLLAAGVVLPGSPVSLWPEVKEALMQRDPLSQWAILSRSYFYTASWSVLWEMLRDPASPLALQRNPRYVHYQPHHLHLELFGLRQFVLRILASLPDGAWVTLPDLEPLLRAIWPHFPSTLPISHRHPHQVRPWSLIQIDRQQPAKAAQPPDWDSAQGAFIRGMIGGPLHWLGLVDLGFYQGELIAFRPRGLADLYWNRQEIPAAVRNASDLAPLEIASEALYTDPETISLPRAAFQAQLHRLLAKITRLVESSGDTLAYRLDPLAAYQAFESGSTLDGIVEEWEEVMPEAMPEHIHDRLSTWWSAYGRVRLYEDVAVVEFADDYALAEMKAVTSLEDQLITEISPRLVLIPPEAIAGLKAELEQAGYTPQETDQS